MRNWVLQGIPTRCIFFNTRVFYHPGGDFYTMVLQNTKKYNKNKKANRRPGKLTNPPLATPTTVRPCAPLLIDPGASPLEGSQQDPHSNRHSTQGQGSGLWGRLCYGICAELGQGDQLSGKCHAVWLTMSHVTG